MKRSIKWMRHTKLLCDHVTPPMALAKVRYKLFFLRSDELSRTTTTPPSPSSIRRTRNLVLALIPPRKSTKEQKNVKIQGKNTFNTQTQTHTLTISLLPDKQTASAAPLNTKGTSARSKVRLRYPPPSSRFRLLIAFSTQSRQQGSFQQLPSHHKDYQSHKV